MIEDRRSIIKKIMVERHFYESYKRIILLQLSSFSLRYIKLSILKIIKSSESYLKKEFKLTKYLKEVIEKEVKFVIMSKKLLLSFITTIEYLSEEEKKKNDYCVFIPQQITLFDLFFT